MGGEDKSLKGISETPSFHWIWLRFFYFNASSLLYSPNSNYYMSNIGRPERYINTHSYVIVLSGSFMKNSFNEFQAHRYV